MLKKGANTAFLLLGAEPLPLHFMVCTVNGEGPLLESLKFQVSLCDITIFDSINKRDHDNGAKSFAKNKAAF